MPGKITFSMIKPDAVQEQHMGEIINMIVQAGFKFEALELVQLTPEKAAEFYIIHKDRPFYTQMCQDMAAGPVIAMILSKENAVADFRLLIGATNPAEAAPNTIRHRFGKSISFNAIHGSDADDTAITEAHFFFPNTTV